MPINCPRSGTGGHLAIPKQRILRGFVGYLADERTIVLSGGRSRHFLGSIDPRFRYTDCQSCESTDKSNGPKAMDSSKTSTAVDNISGTLHSVQKRLRKRNAIAWATTGLVIGCFAAFVLALVSVALVSVAATPIHWLWLPAVVLIGSLLGGIVGLIIPVSATSAARIVDTYYSMKDRAITAMQFESDDDPVRQLQVADARQHLGQVRSDDCVRIEPNRTAFSAAAVLGVLAAGVLLFVGATPSQGIEAQPVKLAISQADELRATMLEELEELKDESPEVEELTEKLDEMLEELANESIDERDMMATLSEMEQAIANVHEALKIEMTDEQMASLAEAISPSEAMKQAAAAMESGEYEKASEQLEQVDPSKLNDKERRAVADNLKKFLAKLAPGQKGELSGAAKELQEGLDKKNDSKCKSGMCKLAGLCKKQGQCKKIGQCMACQLNRLSQCKSQCRCACKSNSDKVAKSNRPSQSWGKGATGKANDGEATKLDSSRQQENLSGVQGDGPSESEVLEAPEGEQAATRGFAKKYQKFKNQAEAVLDTEPLPLGHRETVRQYFENIRPKNAEAVQ